MTVLVLCDTVAYDGGTESYLSRVLPALKALGLEIRLAARRVLDADAFAIPATALGWGSDDEPANAEAARGVRDLIASMRPAAVLTSNVHDAAVMAAARTAPRLVVRIHDHRLFCPQGDRQYPNFRAPCSAAMSTVTCLGNAVLRGCVAGINTKTVRLVGSRIALRDAALVANRFIVSSQYMADLCTLNGVAREQLAIVAPPFAGAIVRSPRPARDRVLFAGRLVRDKGLASLIRAMALMPESVRPQLAVAGAMTNEARSLPGLAARLGVALTMLGKLDNATLAQEIDASSVVAVPSLWPEPFGLMGIEAFARGRPVVAYDTGGIAAWMGNGGILVPRADEASFAHALSSVLEPARWNAYAGAAIVQAGAHRVGDHAARVAQVLVG